ncbi:MAG: TIGR03435 family protein [Granulicella sp.]
MRVLVAAGCVAIGAMVYATGYGYAQAVSKPMSFDVASIRRNVDNIGKCSPDQVQPTANGFHMTNCPLIVAVGAAYVPTTGEALGYLVEDRIVGMPNWLKQEQYNIDAKIASSDAVAWRDPVRRKEMLHAMMQTLLTERCKLVVHREMKDKSIYVLVLGKNGSKLKASQADEVAAIRAKHPEAVAIPGGSGFFVRGQGNGNIDLYGATTGTLTLLLSGPAGRPVVDRTGLTGKYDMHLEMGQPGLEQPAPNVLGDTGASVFSAVQEQLGLKLESQKGQVENLVIDHIERPSPN